MAKKKTVKDVEVEEVSKKKKKEQVKEEVVEEVKEVEEVEDFEGNDDVEEVKKEKKEKPVKEHKDKKEGFFSKIRREMKKVVWPTLWEITKYSIAVIIFCVILCLFFLGINAIASLVRELFN